MATLRFTDDADQDIRNLACYIGRMRRSPQGARNLVDAIDSACEFHAEHPMLGTPLPDLGPDIRVFPCGTKHNPRGFVVVFRPLEDGIEVLRVFRGERDWERFF